MAPYTIWSLVAVLQFDLQRLHIKCTKTTSVFLWQQNGNKVCILNILSSRNIVGECNWLLFRLVPSNQLFIVSSEFEVQQLNYMLKVNCYYPRNSLLLALGFYYGHTNFLQSAIQIIQGKFRNILSKSLQRNSSNRISVQALTQNWK